MHSRQQDGGEWFAPRRFHLPGNRGGQMSNSSGRMMLNAICWVCGSPAPRSSAPENRMHTRVECPKCGTYRVDDPTSQKLGEAILKQVKAGEETPRHPNHEALSAAIRAKYDASGHQEVFIDDLDALVEAQPAPFSRDPQRGPE